MVEDARTTDDSLSILISIVVFPPCAMTYTFSPASPRRGFLQQEVFCMHGQQQWQDQKESSP